MMRRLSRPAIFVSIVILLAVITLPGFFRHCFEVGGGHTFANIVKSENLQLGSMTYEQKATYKSRAMTEGFKHAILMTFGQHIPFYLFILIAFGFLTRSISRDFRIFLRVAFWGVWFLGIFFLTLAMRTLFKTNPFYGVFGIYLIGAIFFGVVIGIGKVIQREKKPGKVTPPTG